MELLYYKASAGNFGDDLNAVMWRLLLPADMFEQDDTVLIGIGSIFNAEQAPLTRTRGKRIFVLGTGAGYGPLPPSWKDWNVLAVRGPLTAALIGRPDLAATDAAALLADLPSILTLAPDRPHTLFIPHHHSMNHGKWESVARCAGLTFVDPRWELSKVMACFSRAKLVVTEAMHGAIIADTSRIPWIPVNTSPDVLPFKWRDWTLSVEVPYKPVALTASSFWERHHHQFLAGQARAQGLTASGLLAEVDSAAFLLQDFAKRYGEAAEAPGVVVPRPARPTTRWHSMKHSTAAMLDPLFIESAALRLARIAQGTSYLSDDGIFANKLGQLQQATHELIKAVRG